MLAKAATRARKQNAPRPAWRVAEAFRQWLRGRECACGGTANCGGHIVAAHVDHAGGKGMGTKVADRHCIPLSDICHKSQHAMGWRTFERIILKRDAVKLAADYWSAWLATPMGAKWTAEQ